MNDEPRSSVGIHPSRLFLLLFLSTEAMFFVALIGSYLIFRVAAGADWPTRSEVHLSLALGTLNTAILLLSSFTMSRCVAAVGSGRSPTAKRLLLGTMLLGSAFLGIKGIEYSTKIEHGLYPRRPRLLVYSRPDINYLAAVKEEIANHRRRLALDTSADDANSAAEIEFLDRLKLGLVDWTARLVAESDNPFEQSISLQSVAFLIEPSKATEPGVASYLAVEFDAIQSEQGALTLRKQQLDSRIDGLMKQLEPGDGAAGNPKSEDSVELQKRQTELVNLRTALAATNDRLSAIDDRLWMLRQLSIKDSKSADDIDELAQGLNDRFGLRLPVVIPNGNRWISGYWLLTGFHALHVFAGLVVMGFLACRRLSSHRWMFAHNLGTYWHFVDCVWLVIYPLIYWW